MDWNPIQIWKPYIFSLTRDLTDSLKSDSRLLTMLLFEIGDRADSLKPDSDLKTKLSQNQRSNRQFETRPKRANHKFPFYI